jgi:hypothetical protein
MNSSNGRMVSTAQRKAIAIALSIVMLFTTGYGIGVLSAININMPMKTQSVVATTEVTTTVPTTLPTTVPTTEPTTIPPMMGVMPYIIDGDANNDSAVSIADAAAILQYIANPDKYGLSGKGMMQADVVGNGNGITVDDAIAIQKLDAKIIDDFSELE